MSADRRAYDRQWHQRRRDAALEREQLRLARCPRRAGPGVCRGVLETYIDDKARTRVRCPFCERRRAGVCRDCSAPVYGAIGRAMRCAKHAHDAQHRSMRASEERHHEQRRAAGREYYNKPEVKARRNEYKRLWRKQNPEKVREQKKRFVERHRANPNSWYNRYHRRYRARYRLQKRELERDRARATMPGRRKTSPKCTRCGKATRWRPVHKGHAGRPWTVCTACLFPSMRRIRQRHRRRALARAKEWLASIPAPSRIRRPPTMAKRGPGWERLCVTPGCETVLTHRRKKCTKCLDADRRLAEQKLAPGRGRGHRSDLGRVA